jgi:Zn ribbon nucleic-acid-binding protein
MTIHQMRIITKRRSGDLGRGYFSHVECSCGFESKVYDYKIAAQQRAAEHMAQVGNSIGETKMTTHDTKIITRRRSRGFGPGYMSSFECSCGFKSRSYDYKDWAQKHAKEHTAEHQQPIKVN